MSKFEHRLFRCGKSNFHGDEILLVNQTHTIDRIKAIADAGLMRDIWQFPTVMVPLAINGGGESIVLRPVDSMEAMTARFFPLDKKVLQKITNEVMALGGIGSVLFDLTNKPPGTIEWE